MRKMLVLLISVLSFGLSANAQELGMTGGFSSSQAEAKTAGVSEDSSIGYRFGASVKFNLMDQLNFKTGLLYVYRPFTFKTSGTEYDLKFAYLDLPATMEFKFNDMIGVFGGVIVGINVSDNNSLVGDPREVEELIAHLQGGVSFLFDDLYGFDIYMEKGMGDIYNNAKDYTTYGANFVYYIY